MPDLTVLSVGRDPAIVRWVDEEMRRLPGPRLAHFDDAEAACDFATDSETGDRLGLILVQVAGDPELSDVTRLLWVSSTLRRPVPVVVVSERYQVGRASTLFQLGVTDCLSRSHHRDRLSAVIETLAVRSRREGTPVPADARSTPDRRSLVSVS